MAERRLDEIPGNDSVAVRVPLAGAGFRLNREERFLEEARPHFRAMYGTALRLTRNPADAEDLVQETLLRAFRGLDGYTPGTNARAWLFTILHRARLDAVRRDARRPVAVELEEADAPVPPPQDLLARGHEEVEAALGRVPEVYRAALLLRDVEELSYEEIARMLDVPAGTVMSRIHRGRRLLRAALAPRETP
ncbi:MAG: sigma-70 family RNA polymerase sigma factor [Vicinamibacteria bacterium]|nr:sigma-70 family RNA polymerase sigma factor [Vicinamibacteria bacterium]